MKKFTLMLIVALLSLTAMAQRSAQKPAHAQPGRAYTTAERMKLMPAGKKAVRKAPAKFAKKLVKGTAKAGAQASDVVYKAPEGTTYEAMARNTITSYVFWGYVFSSDESWLVAEMTEAENGDLWLKNPITNYAVGTYLHLTKTGEGQYVAQLPQAIDAVYLDEETAAEEFGIDHDTTIVYSVARFESQYVEEDGETYEERVFAENQEIKFTWDGHVLRMEDEAIMGLTDDEAGWYGYDDEEFDQFVVPFVAVTCVDAESVVERQVVVEDHPSADTKDFTMATAVYAGSKVFLKGLSGAPGYIEGDVDLLTQTVTIKSGQYLGASEESGYHEFFFAADTTMAYDDVWDEWYPEYHFKEQAALNLDLVSQKVTTQSNREALVVNAGIEFDADLSEGEEEEEALDGDDFFSIDLDNLDYATIVPNFIVAYTTPIFSLFTEVAATPATPVITGVEPYDPDYGYGLVYVIIPTEDVDGNFINPEKLSYRMYFDDEQVVFSADDYTNLPIDVDEIPYTFDDDYDLDFYQGEFWISYFADGMDKIGIQSVYRGGDEEHESEIAWYQMTEDGIRLVGTTPAEASAKTYDLQGRLVKNAGKGLYIVGGKKVLK
ncbi:MAG: hypothetical protein IKR63_03780 [Alloprevotella sp.]|nr:hypothetical protein [Alloprevotella sp.]